MWSIFSRDPTKDFGYEVGKAVGGLEDQSIWILHEGKRKVSLVCHQLLITFDVISPILVCFVQSNGDPVSIFAFDVAANSDAVHQVAQASVKRLKTLRHPNVLTFIDRWNKYLWFFYQVLCNTPKNCGELLPLLKFTKIALTPQPQLLHAVKGI